MKLKEKHQILKLFQHLSIISFFAQHFNFCSTLQNFNCWPKFQYLAKIWFL